MTDSIVYLFVSGLAFPIGAGMLVAGVGLLLFLRGFVARAAGRVLVMAGLVVAWLSATPMPVWSFAGLVVLTSFWFVAEAGRSRYGRRPLRMASFVLIVATVGCALGQVPHYVLPHLPPLGGRTIYVIGDSISAGAGSGRDALWPGQLDRLLPHTHVINFAQAGATCASALVQARRVPDPDACILLEIGGNDLLARAAPAAFRRDLEALLEEVCQGDREVVMFELPLPPLDGQYGRVQRELARRHGVMLIPRRCFARIITTPADTVDGLHLSPAGQKAMARLVASIIRP